MNRLKIILAKNETLHEMLIGVAGSNVVLLCIALLVFSDKGKAALGVIYGTLVACFYLVHMAVTIDDALCLDEKGAMAQMRKHMLIRYVCVCAAVAILCITNFANPICCILSCLSVKLGAYLQPVVRYKILKRSDPPAPPVSDDEGSEDGGKISE